MKPVSQALLQILSSPNFLIGDLYAFTLVDGAEDYFSALDQRTRRQGHDDPRG